MWYQKKEVLSHLLSFRFSKALRATAAAGLHSNPCGGLFYLSAYHMVPKLFGQTNICAFFLFSLEHGQVRCWTRWILSLLLPSDFPSFWLPFYFLHFLGEEFFILVVLFFFFFPFDLRVLPCLLICCLLVLTVCMGSPVFLLFRGCSF